MYEGVKFFTPSYIYEGVKFFMTTLLFFRHYIKNICILRNRLINFITVNLKHC